jgi:hypothetical protein
LRVLRIRFCVREESLGNPIMTELSSHQSYEDSRATNVAGDQFREADLYLRSTWRARQEIAADDLPRTLGLVSEREGAARLFNASLHLVREPPTRGQLTDPERSLLLLFETGRSLARPEVPPNDKESLAVLLKLPSDNPIRSAFLEQVATIALRRASRKDEPYGSKEALDAVVHLHPAAGVLLHRIFVSSVNPDNRAGMIRVIGAVDKNIQRELFESVFDTFVSESLSFRSGMGSGEGIAVLALQLHDSIRLLQRVERLFDRDTPAFEIALTPFREQARKNLEHLIVRDRGKTAVETLKRSLGYPLSPEELGAVLRPMMQAIGGNGVNPQEVVAFAKIPGVQKWLSSESMHSLLLPPPSLVQMPIAHAAFSEALQIIRAVPVEERRSNREASSAVRALVRIARYLGRSQAPSSSSILRSDELEQLSREALTLGEAGVALYREMLGALTQQMKGCPIAMQSLFAHHANGLLSPTAQQTLQVVIRDAVLLYPEVVLCEAVRSREPEGALEWIVGSLASARDSAGNPADKRADEMLRRWQLLVKEQRVWLLAWGAPLSREHERFLLKGLTRAFERLEGSFGGFTDGQRGDMAPL